MKYTEFRGTEIGKKCNKWQIFACADAAPIPLFQKLDIGKFQYYLELGTICSFILDPIMKMVLKSKITSIISETLTS